MHRNIARAYDYLLAEHGRVRAVCIRILSQSDKRLERTLLRADMNDEKHLDEMLLYEGRLSRPERRKILDLNCYGRKIERIMASLLRL